MSLRFLACAAGLNLRLEPSMTRRNVSTTLIQPGLEFKLGYEALIERRRAVRVRQRLVLAGAIRGSDRGGAWVRVA